MKMFMIFILSLFSFNAFAGIQQNTSFDLGIVMSPTFTPESGYDGAKLRLGIEAAVSLYKLEDRSYVNIKGISNPDKTTIKLLRVGVAFIENEAVLTLAPISLFLKDKVYVTTSLGFSKKPYTVFSISYELF